MNSAESGPEMVLTLIPDLGNASVGNIITQVLYRFLPHQVRIFCFLERSPICGVTIDEKIFPYRS